LNHYLFVFFLLPLSSSQDLIFEILKTKDYKKQLKENDYNHKFITGFGAKHHITRFKKEEGLSNVQIMDIMKLMPIKVRNTFKGVFPIDYMDKIADLCDKNDNYISFILNLDNHDKPGYHWVACYIDKIDNKSINYYDSYAEEPPNRFLKDIDLIIDKIKPVYYLKLKINRIVEQATNTSTCGWFAIRFIVNMVNGKSFKDCTKFSDVRNNEKAIQLFKTKFTLV